MNDFTHISLDIEHDLDNWDVANERPTGSREKLTLIRNSDNQHFIFKLPKEHREHQIWSELLASFIAGDLLGWDVQHVSLGIRNEKPGNLLRYIYQPEIPEHFIEGWQLCKEVDPDFDVDKGQHHTLPLILRTHADVIAPNYKIKRSDFMIFWSRALALDTLISNTDRHAENWAVIVSSEYGSEARIAALYDHGSSMGCGLDSIGLNRFFDNDGRLVADRMNRFRKSGRHHVRLEEPMKKGAHFEPLCYKLLEHYPDGRVVFEEVAGIDLRAVKRLVQEIVTRVELPKPYALTDRRAEHVCAILEIGMERIKNILSETKK